MDALASHIFHCLRCMDAEATTVRDGFPTGLYWYGGHVHPEQSRPHTEPNWVHHLAERLGREGVDAQCEVTYPSRSRRRCDLVVTLPDGSSLWLEVKGAWKEYWRRLGRGDRLYRSYLLHPLVPGLDQTKTHTAALDLKKIEALDGVEAGRAGLLLIGFDSLAAPMDGDVAELIALAGLDADPWRVHYAAWSDPHRVGETAKCWFWHRRLQKA